MSKADRDKWDARYLATSPGDSLSPNSWLRDRVRTMRPGKALDLACGLGDNALWLSQLGWDVQAVDISAVGLRHAAERGERLGLRVNWVNADLESFVPEEDLFDLVTVFRFLDRVRLPVIVPTALRPGGVLLYETFRAKPLRHKNNHIHNPNFVLADGELAGMFPGLHIMHHAEVNLGDCHVAQLAAKRPSSAERTAQTA